MMKLAMHPKRFLFEIRRYRVLCVRVPDEEAIEFSGDTEIEFVLWSNGDMSLEGVFPGLSALYVEELMPQMVDLQ